MYVALSLAVLVQYVAAGPWFEMSQARHVQADIKLGRDIEHIFHDFKVAHSKFYLLLYISRLSHLWQMDVPILII